MHKIILHVIDQSVLAFQVPSKHIKTLQALNYACIQALANNRIYMAKLYYRFRKHWKSIRLIKYFKRIQK